ncbi:hypothetical protein HY230_04125, partial [Candidatus Acetothermia bacterium]|nr:hypothetical protein [Candidatus Acetothermia bacterium]
MKRIIHKTLILLALSGTAVVWLLGVGRAQQPEPPPPSPEETIQGQQFTATGQIYSGPLFSTPPQPSPEIRERIEEEMAHPRVGPAIPVTPRGRVGNARPTRPLLNAPQAPGDFVFFKNSILGSGTNNFTSIIGEPNAGSNGSAMFQTGNWYASVSGNGGTSFSYVDPYTLFPATGSFSGGFCCDQRVAHAPNQEMVLWFLQYSSTGSTPNDTNGVRIAAAVGPSNLVNNTWCTLDFTPALFGIGLGQEFDFPNLQVSNNYVYATINLFSITSGTFTQAVMWRVPLTA